MGVEGGEKFRNVNRETPYLVKLYFEILERQNLWWVNTSFTTTSLKTAA